MLNPLIFQMKKNSIKNNCIEIIIVLLIGIIFSSCSNSSDENTNSNSSDSSTTFLEKAISKITPKKKIEHCEFDMKQQTDAFLKDKTKYASYKWNNQSKEASLLVDGKDTLTIHRGGCHYFELSINLKSITKNNTISDSLFWFDMALGYAKDFFEKTDYDILKKNIDMHEYEVSGSEDVKLYSFPHEKYDEFYIRLSSEHKAKEVEVGYSYSQVTEN